MQRRQRSLTCTPARSTWPADDAVDGEAVACLRRRTAASVCGPNCPSTALERFLQTRDGIGFAGFCAFASPEALPRRHRAFEAGREAAAAFTAQRCERGRPATPSTLRPCCLELAHALRFLSEDAIDRDPSACCRSCTAPSAPLESTMLCSVVVAGSGLGVVLIVS